MVIETIITKNNCCIALIEGSSAAEVQHKIWDITEDVRNASFTTPEMTADGRYVSIGHYTEIRPVDHLVK